MPAADSVIGHHGNLLSANRPLTWSDVTGSSSGKPAGGEPDGGLAGPRTLPARPSGEGWTATVGGRQLQLAALDEDCSPQAGVTRRELLEWYLGVSPLLLPHLRERPLEMHTAPAGSGEVPADAPAWLEIAA